MIFLIPRALDHVDVESKALLEAASPWVLALQVLGGRIDWLQLDWHRGSGQWTQWRVQRGASRRWQVARVNTPSTLTSLGVQVTARMRRPAADSILLTETLEATLASLTPWERSLDGWRSDERGRLELPAWDRARSAGRVLTSEAVFARLGGLTQLALRCAIGGWFKQRLERTPENTQASRAALAFYWPERWAFVPWSNQVLTREITASNQTAGTLTESNSWNSDVVKPLKSFARSMFERIGGGWKVEGQTQKDPALPLASLADELGVLRVGAALPSAALTPARTRRPLSSPREATRMDLVGWVRCMAEAGFPVLFDPEGLAAYIRHDEDTEEVRLDLPSGMGAPALTGVSKSEWKDLDDGARARLSSWTRWTQDHLRAAEMRDRLSWTEVLLQSANAGVIRPSGFTDVSYDRALGFLQTIGFSNITAESRDGEAFLLLLQGCVPRQAGSDQAMTKAGPDSKGENSITGDLAITLVSNVINKYNDCAILCYVERPQGGALSRHAKCYLATVEAGWHTGNERSGAGVGHSTYGWHQFVVGWHHPGASNGRLALRGHLNGDSLKKGKANRCWRDSREDSDGTWSPDWLPEVNELLGTSNAMNLHDGARQSTEVDNYSTGCVNIAGGRSKSSPFVEFRTLVKKHCRCVNAVETGTGTADTIKADDGTAQTPLNVYILDGGDFIRYCETWGGAEASPPAFNFAGVDPATAQEPQALPVLLPTLRLGARGPVVRYLKLLLAKRCATQTELVANMLKEPAEEWNNATTKVLEAFLKPWSATPTLAICDAVVWAHLQDASFNLATSTGN